MSLRNFTPRRTRSMRLVRKLDRAFAPMLIPDPCEQLPSLHSIQLIRQEWWIGSKWPTPYWATDIIATKSGESSIEATKDRAITPNLRIFIEQRCAMCGEPPAVRIIQQLLQLHRINVPMKLQKLVRDLEGRKAHGEHIATLCILDNAAWLAADSLLIPPADTPAPHAPSDPPGRNRPAANRPPHSARPGR